ncbi:MAG: glutathione transferase GstA [Pseudomonadota bacterium]
MKLYVAPGACSLAPHIALREAGARFDLAIVDLGSKRADDGTTFTEINPKGYVPALQLDDGQVLTENVVVLLYIADRHPEAHLAPAALSMERYRLIEWLCFINSELHKAFSPLFSPAAPEPMRQYARDLLTRRFDYLQGVLGDTPFVIGTGFTVADAYLYTVLSWCAEVGIDLKRWPGLARHEGRSRTRPAVLAALKAEGLVP